MRTSSFSISDFVSNRFAIIEIYLHHGIPCSAQHDNPDVIADTGKFLSLSQIEYSRLARAFYHLELWSHRYDRPRSHGKNDVFLEQSTVFLQSLKDWELEGLLCVRNYFPERLKDYLNQLEDDFMQGCLENQPRINERGGPNNRWTNHD